MADYKKLFFKWSKKEKDLMITGKIKNESLSELSLLLLTQSITNNLEQLQNYNMIFFPGYVISVRVNKS